MTDTPDPRFLAGEDAVLTDVSKMAWAIVAGWDGAVDVQANIPKKLLAVQLRYIADQWDPPRGNGGDHGPGATGGPVGDVRRVDGGADDAPQPAAQAVAKVMTDDGHVLGAPDPEDGFRPVHFGDGPSTGGVSDA